MKVQAGEHGLVVYELHQSDINTYLLCPERARRLWSGEVTDPPNDRTAVGTAVHAAIEAYLLGCGLDDALTAAHVAWTREEATPGFRYVKAKSQGTCFNHIRTAFKAWRDHVYPTLGNPLGIEEPFNLSFDVEARGNLGIPLRGDSEGYECIEIRLGGRVDYTDEMGLWDWKTGTNLRKYTPRFGAEGWQLQRWGVQPTTYTWAMFQLGLIEPSEGSVSFTYAAIDVRTGQVSYLPCSRSESDWAWLKKVCWNIVKTHLADLDEWPVNDQHALCSPVWCPAYAVCKGAVCKGAETSDVAEKALDKCLTSR